MRSLWTLLVEWTRRDFRVRYAQTLFGGIWAFAAPLAMTVGFVFVFEAIARIDAGVPYAAFVYPGAVLWGLFAGGVIGASSSTLESMSIASKVAYPRIVAPLAAIAHNVVDFAIGLLFLPVILIVFQAPVRLNPLSFTLAILGTLAMAIGLGSFLSALVVFVRDVRKVLPFFFQIAVLVTPVAYPADRVPVGLRPLVVWNPMATLVAGFRSSLIALPSPTTGEWARALLVCAVVAALGVAYYQSVDDRFADVA